MLRSRRLVIAAVFFIGLIVGGGVYFWQRQTFKPTKEDLSQAPLETPQPTQEEKYTNWQNIVIVNLALY